MEHLVPSDTGIIRYRQRLRKLCRDLEKGIEPGQVAAFGAKPVPTFGGDTVLCLPSRGGDERERLRELGERFMQIQYNAEDLPEAERVARVIEALQTLETEYGR